MKLDSDGAGVDVQDIEAAADELFREDDGVDVVELVRDSAAASSRTAEFACSIVE
jgi:hypothetical protein